MVPYILSTIILALVATDIISTTTQEEAIINAKPGIKCNNDRNNNGQYFCNQEKFLVCEELTCECPKYDNHLTLFREYGLPTNENYSTSYIFHTQWDSTNETCVSTLNSLCINSDNPLHEIHCPAPAADANEDFVCVLVPELNEWNIPIKIGTCQQQKKKLLVTKKEVINSASIIETKTSFGVFVISFVLSWIGNA